MPMQRSRVFGALLLVVALATLAAPPSAAQQPDIAAAEKRFQDLAAAGNYAAAFAEAQKLEAAVKARSGTNNPTYIRALNNLAGAHQYLGRYREAEGLFKQVLATLEKNLGPNDGSVAQVLTNLATVYVHQSRHAEAEPLYQRAIAITEKGQGPRSAALAPVLKDLAEVYLAQVRYDDADRLLSRALALVDAPDGDQARVAMVLNSQARVLEAQGRYRDAEASLKRALATNEKARGSDHPDVAANINNLAHVYEREGRYVEADGLYRRAMSIWEQALGPQHPHLATALLNLALVYTTQGRFDEADQLYQRSLGIRKQVFGPRHAHVATVLNNMAQLHEVQGNYTRVEAFAKQALDILEKPLGPSHPDVAKILRKLAVAYDGQGRHDEAEQLLQRAVGIQEKSLGPDHPFVATIVSHLARVKLHQRRYDDAERLNKRALAIMQKARGADHPEAARILDDLASISAAQNRTGDALAYARDATSATIRHAHAEHAGVRTGIVGDGGSLIEKRGSYFVNHLAQVAAAAAARLEPAEKLGYEGFETAQWANQSTAGAAIQQMASRFGSGNDALVGLVRESQDLSAAWREKDKLLFDAVSKPPDQQSQSAIATLRQQIAEIERRHGQITVRLEKEFPDYTALTQPRPLSTLEAQGLLSQDEALAFWLAGEKESYLFALTREGFRWHVVPAGQQMLSDMVARLRNGLDVEKLSSSIDAGEPVLFDLGLAHELYALLLGPADGLIKGKRRLMVVPTGALTAIPFHLLVTEKPAVAVPAKQLGLYRNAAWLVKRHAVTVLPSVASLKALRVLAKSAAAGKPMIGFGDPVYSSGQAVPAPQRAAGKATTRTRGYSEYWRGAGVDRGMLAATLPSLPDTATELNAIAANLGIPAGSILLGRAASETNVKRANLSEFRIVYFATHGLVAGDVKGLGEPALALTLPAEPSELDDGLLTASEVAQLKLNADWVVLSACNTAAGDKPGAEALSGLARAFFYTGARALLVSHWSVDSRAATRVTTATFEALKADPSIGRAEALRRAMVNYLEDTSDVQNAYPAYWGAFSLVGEGATR
jgi:CHAT domain-containing protein/tetratricopeptide (TPR) repeat protein